MPFVDRVDAGKRLAAALDDYRDRDPVVLALPRGGVPVAAEIAARLGAPLDVIIVRKIGVPFQPELAMGSIVEGNPPFVVRNEDVIRLADIDEAEFRRVQEQEEREIERRRGIYIGDRPRADVRGRTAIVVDDGLATGATMRAALAATRRAAPKSLVLAVPVAPTGTLAELRREVDDLVCLENHEPFFTIGAYYRDFRQLTDEDVLAALAGDRSTPKQRDHAPG